MLNRWIILLGRENFGRQQWLININVNDLTRSFFYMLDNYIDLCYFSYTLHNDLHENCLISINTSHTHANFVRRCCCYVATGHNLRISWRIIKTAYKF
jgi:hypothetical protein